MAKHHPDLIFCRKQAGVGETVPCSVWFQWDGIANWGLGAFSSLALWFGGSMFRAIRSLGILEARSGLLLLISAGARVCAKTGEAIPDCFGFGRVQDSFLGTGLWCKAKFRAIGRAW